MVRKHTDTLNMNILLFVITTGKIKVVVICYFAGLVYCDVINCIMVYNYYFYCYLGDYYCSSNRKTMVSHEESVLVTLTAMET